MPPQGRKPPQRKFSVAGVTHPTADGPGVPSPAVAEEGPQDVQGPSQAGPEGDAAQPVIDTPQGPPEGAPPPKPPPSAAEEPSKAVTVERTTPAAAGLGALVRRSKGPLNPTMHATLTRGLATELMSLRSLADRLTAKQTAFENLAQQALDLGYPLEDVNQLCAQHEWFPIEPEGSQQGQQR